MKKSACGIAAVNARSCLLVLLCLLAMTCSIFLSFPSELEGKWYNYSLQYYTEWFSFSGNTMEYYSSFYGETYSYTLTSMDKNKTEFSVKSSGGSNSTYTYSISGGTLTLTADTGMVWNLKH
jgi:hypothetical protein